MWSFSFGRDGVFILDVEALSLNHARSNQRVRPRLTFRGGHFINSDRGALIPRELIGPMHSANTEKFARAIGIHWTRALTRRRAPPAS